MALVLADRVQETTATTGTGSITLGGAVSGYQSFAVVGNGNTCYYTIVNGSAWEVGIGTYSTTGPTLARTTVLSNSNADTSPITLSGASSIFLTYPAEKSINYDANGVATIGSVLSYSDTGVIASFASTVAGYNQVVLQNKSTATNASANLNVSNDASTSTTGFAELGINSSTFTGSGSFSIAGAAYLASASTDLTIGTYGAYNIHFVTNSNTVDAMTIFNDGGVSLGGYGDPGIGNLAANKFVPGFVSITSAGGTTTLTAASDYYQRVVGTSTQTLKLPDATTLLKGTTFVFDNDSTGTVTIKDGASTTIESIPATGVDYIYLIDNSTVAGTWVAYSFNPSNYDFTSTSANFGGATISNAIWNGTAIASDYGGTGLTTFVAANNALYSTSSSALTAGTLPVAAGGTGITSLTANYIPVGNGTSAFTSSSSLQFASGVLVVGGSSVLGGATNPITAFTGSANNYIQTYVYNQSTGISASADFVAYGNNSTDAHGWADLGFTGSGYNDPVYTVTGPNEAYVFGSALNSSYTGNLVYATDSTGSANAHQWYVGGFTQLKSAWKMQLTSTGLQLANALAVSYGGTGSTTASGARTNLGATTVGGNMFTLTNPSAITFPRFNADNTVSALDAASFRTAIGAGTSSTTGTVTSVATGTGLTGGTITTTGTISLTNTAVTAGSYTNSSITVDAQGRLTSASSGTAPVTSVTGTAPVVSSGGATPAISMAAASAGVNGYMTGVYATKLDGIAAGAQPGTVTSVATGTGLSGGTITTSGTISLANTTVTAGSYTSSNITVDAQGRITAASSGAGASPGGATTQVQYNNAGAFAGSANLTFNGTNLTCGGTVTANSDESLKANWRDLPTDFVEQLAKVKHGTYDRVDIELTQDGVSAQSLQPLLPNSVLKGEDGKLSVAYGNAALVAAIKLAERVVALEARLAALEK